MKKAFLVLLFLTAILFAGSGGPDGHGYTWISSRATGGPDPFWIEISGTGTRLTTVSDRDITVEYVAFERPFDYYGDEHAGISIASSGVAAFGRWSYISYFRSVFPSTSTPNATLSPFWTYLRPSMSHAPDAGVYYQDFGDYVVIQWNKLVESGTTNEFTFQIVIDYRIRAIFFNYLSIPRLTSRDAIIGIESLDGRDGLLCGRNSTTGTDFAVNGLTVRFRGTPTAIPPYFNDFTRGDDMQLPRTETGWEWGVPTYGPPSAYSEPNCIGTNLSGNYDNNANWLILTPDFDLRYSETAVWDFYAWYDIEEGIDGGFCEISTNGGFSWTQIHPEGGYPGRLVEGSPLEGLYAFTGTSDGWEYYSIDLTPYCGLNVKCRFNFFSDARFAAPGLYIDNMGLHEKHGFIRGMANVAYLSVNAGVEIELVGTELTAFTGPDGLFFFDSVAIGEEYTVRFSKPGYLTDSLTDVIVSRLDTTELYINIAPELYFNDFSQNNGGWIAIPDSGGWEWGKPNPMGQPNLAYSDSFCWGTNLDGNYADNASFVLEQTLFIGTIENPAIRFMQWYSFAGEFMGEIFDGGNVKVSTDGGSSFDVLIPDRRYDVTYDGLIADYNHYMSGQPAFGGQRNGNFWHQVSFDLSPYKDQITLLVRLEMASDAMGNSRGWYIDNFQLFDNWDAVFDEPLGTLPSMLSVKAAPNPFNSSCRITYSIPYDANVFGDMLFYSLDGRIVHRLPVINKPGSYTTKWSPGSLPGGLYLIVLPTDKGIIQQKVLYIK